MRAVQRTINILELLATAPTGVRLTEICRQAGLDGSTALRYLKALAKLGYAVVVPGGGLPVYQLGPRVGRLGGVADHSLLQRVARPGMEALSAACGEDVNLGTMDAGRAVCLETQETSHLLEVNIASGLRMAPHASSIGKAMLAFLPHGKREAILRAGELERFTPNTIVDADELRRELEETRRRGYSVDREEISPGVVCIGAPLFNAQGQVVASLSITVPTQRISLDELERRQAGALLETCEAISRALGCPTYPPAELETSPTDGTDAE